MKRFRRPNSVLLFFLLFLFGLVVLFSVRAGFLFYIRSESFRLRVTDSINRVFKATGTLMPLHYSGGLFYSDGFAATGNEGAFFSELRADEIRAVFNWRGVLGRRYEIDELTVQRLNVRFADVRPQSPAPSKVEPGQITTSGGWKLDLHALSVSESNWTWDTSTGTKGSITGSALTLRPSGDDAWIIESNSGKVSEPGWPALSIESTKLRYTHSSLYLNEVILRADDGRLNLGGTIDFGREAELRAEFRDMPVTPLLAPDWRLRLSGKVTGSAQIHSQLNGSPFRYEADLHLIEGRLEALPLLDQIATFTHTERFRHLALTTTSLSLTRDGNSLSARNVILESEGLLRVEGGCTIVNGQIDGVFQVGVTAASLQWLPGSQARVFTVSRDGYFWTSVHLSGPADHPTEDLSARLIAAAAGELLQNSQDTLRDTVKGVLDLIPH
jgi:hypothetical protein